MEECIEAACKFFPVQGHAYNFMAPGKTLTLAGKHSPNYESHSSFGWNAYVLRNEQSLWTSPLLWIWLWICQGRVAVAEVWKNAGTLTVWLAGEDVGGGEVASVGLWIWVHIKGARDPSEAQVWHLDLWAPCSSSVCICCVVWYSAGLGHMLCCGFTNFLLRGVSRDHALRIAVLPAWLQKKKRWEPRSPWTPGCLCLFLILADREMCMLALCSCHLGNSS